MHIEFTQADESHVEDLVDLVNSAYRGDFAKQGWTTEADILDGQRTDDEAMLAMIEKEHSVVLIAEDDDTGELLGCVHLEQHERGCYLGMLTVRPDLQGKGLGKMLIQEAEAFAEFWDCKKIFMTVISVRKELIAWYEKLGFKKTGETEAFPEDPRFGIPKVEKLEFVYLERNI